MGASLGPVLANIIMTELERVVVDDLVNDGTLKFYARYVDDTLFMLKPELSLIHISEPTRPY